MEAPFFLLANLWCNITNTPNDGYTAVHGFFIMLGAMIYCFLALLLIYKLLVPRFGFFVSLLTTILLYYGTNLVYYTISEPAMSHVYSFFLIALFIYKTESFYKRPSFVNILWLAVPIALLTLIRQTNLIIAVYLVFYNVTSWDGFLERMKFWFKKWYYIPAILLVIFIVFIPQMVYWHLITGKWYIFAYGYNPRVHEAFIYWNKPKLSEVLAGPVSGWLTYSPVMLLSMIGLVWMVIRKQVNAWVTAVVFLVALYVIASWWCYTMDCGFGHRGFVDFYALLAIPMAFAIYKLVANRHILLKTVLVAVFVCLCYLNIRLSMMYKWDPCWNGNSWTWKHYSNVIVKAASGGDYKANYHQLAP